MFTFRVHHKGMNSGGRGGGVTPSGGNEIGIGLVKQLLNLTSRNMQGLTPLKHAIRKATAQAPHGRINTHLDSWNPLK